MTKKTTLFDRSKIKSESKPTSINAETTTTPDTINLDINDNKKILTKSLTTVKKSKKLEIKSINEITPTESNKVNKSVSSLAPSMSISISAKNVKISKSAKKITKKLKQNQQKWQKICSHLDEYMTKKRSRFVYYIYKGISEPHRGLAWNAILMRHLEHNNLQLLKNLPTIFTGDSPFADQITKDVNRTHLVLPQHTFPSIDMRTVLFNILNTYAIFDPSVGYTQGMNEVAAFLLQYLIADDALRGFIILNTCKIYGLRGLYSDGLPLLKFLNSLISTKISSQLPALKKHFDKIGYDFTITSTKWIMCIFVQNFPEQLVVRFWDAIIADGSVTIVYITIALLLYFKQSIMKLDMDGIATLFQTNTKTMSYNIEKIMQEVKRISTSLKSGVVRKSIATELNNHSPENIRTIMTVNCIDKSLNYSLSNCKSEPIGSRPISRRQSVDIVHSNNNISLEELNIETLNNFDENNDPMVNVISEMDMIDSVEEKDILSIPVVKPKTLLHSDSDPPPPLSDDSISPPLETQSYLEARQKSSIATQRCKDYSNGPSPISNDVTIINAPNSYLMSPIQVDSSQGFTTPPSDFDMEHFNSSGEDSTTDI